MEAGREAGTVDQVNKSRLAGAAGALHQQLELEQKPYQSQGQDQEQEKDQEQEQEQENSPLILTSMPCPEVFTIWEGQPLMLCVLHNFGGHCRLLKSCCILGI